MNLARTVMQRMGASRNYALRDQMMRSAISIPSNIAEGYERRSDRELIRFLRIAAGSNAELRTQLYLARAADELGAPEADEMIEQTQKIAAQLVNFIKAREERETGNGRRER